MTSDEEIIEFIGSGRSVPAIRLRFRLPASTVHSLLLRLVRERQVVGTKCSNGIIIWRRA
jgi:DNA-binding IclR family transcriptional regulator